MELSFENHHLVAVVVFMVVLLFCKQVLECLQSFASLWQSCALNFGCCHYGHEELLRGGLLALLLSFSVLQPVVFVLVKFAVNALRGSPGFWTVNFVHVNFNVSAFPHKHTASQAMRRPQPDSVRVGSTSVDGLLLIMPFALCACCSTYTWFSMKAAGEFAKDPMWDTELFSNRRMQLYEVVYALEMFLMFFALLTLTADPAQGEYTFVCALLATFILMYFSANARMRSSTDRASESLVGIFLFASLNTLISTFVSQHWAANFPVKIFSACLLAGFVVSLAVLHMSVSEESRAGQVILGRTIVSCSCSLYFAVLLAVDANSLH
jgi:hypothetical protein